MLSCWSNDVSNRLILSSGRLMQEKRPLLFLLNPSELFELTHPSILLNLQFTMKSYLTLFLWAIVVNTRSLGLNLPKDDFEEYLSRTLFRTRNIYLICFRRRVVIRICNLKYLRLPQVTIFDIDLRAV